MLGLLWAASSLSTSSSTAEEVGVKPYNEDLLYPRGSKYKIECLHVFPMI